MPIQPGFGCDAGLVDRIRADMQQRVDARGNMGQIKQLEKMMVKFGDFAAELPLMMDKVGADTLYPPSQETMSAVYGQQGPDIRPPEALPHAVASQQFETREFNIRNELTNCCCFALSCGLAGCTSHKITLESEQVVTQYHNNCMTSTDKEPYAQLRAVDEEVVCCCHMVNWMIPGWCGDTRRIHEIASELQSRKVGRGNIAQLRNQENTMIKALEAATWLGFKLNTQLRTSAWTSYFTKRAWISLRLKRR